MRCWKKPGEKRRHQWAGQEICGSMFQRSGGRVSGDVVVAAYFISNEAQSRYLPDIFK